ncbi:pas domain s-box [Haloferax mucosum ATCC BAA-1512]|uniref:histidine kinase n=1 Tax=Haloferax mucosum ATCC BAA-1512 TaxID=662479 RepID=M0IQ62_9EURY|nr:PAS domain S-box protein [Haloferax mucosum]ELZ98177.1 pas domain s-box [Haloferax mucosum ATCC BAA-1512]
MNQTIDDVRLELALEKSRAILWEWDPASNTTTVIPSSMNLLGRDISSFTDFLACIHPEDRESVVESVESILEAESSFDLDFRILRNGSVRVISTRGSAYSDPDTGETRLIGTSRDVTEQKRRQREFQTIVEHSSDVITVVDSEGIVEYVSPAVRRVFGYEADEVVGTPLSDYIHPLDREDAVSVLLDSGSTSDGSPERVVYRLRHGDGAVRWVESRVTPMEDGPDRAVVINTHDVTGRVEAEHALERTDESRSLALKASQAGIWEWEIETDQLNWHSSAEQLFGIPEGSFEGTYEAFARRVHDDDLPALEAAIGRTIEEDEPFNLDYRIVRDDGVERWITTRGKVLTDADGNPTRLIGVGVDITEQKEREQELEQYKRIVETATDPIYVLDGMGEFTLVNEALAEATGRSKAELVGSNIADLLEPSEVEASLEHIMQLVSDGPDPPPLGLTLSTPEGTREYEVNITLNSDGAEGGTFSTVGVARDVTNLREHQRRLSVMDRVLRHNIRNKLNLVLAHSSSLEEQPDEEVQTHARGIRSAAESLADLSESARRFKSSIHPDNAHATSSNVTDRVARVVDEARLQFPNATFEVTQDGPAWGVVHESFELAINELVQNAVQHADHAEPTVKITVEQHESTVSVLVEDDGPGLSEMERDIILQGEESPLEHGLGLGLWLVRWTIDNSGGTIDVRENDPRGTVVEVRIPRLPEGEPS